MKRLRRYAVMVTILLCIVYLLFDWLNPGVEYDYQTQETHQQKIKRISTDLNFAGEKVHFKSPDAYSRYFRELKINNRNNSSSRLLMYDVSVCFPLIEQILRRHKVPDDIKYVAVAESNLHMKVSRRGAAGVWQLRDFTAREYGLEVNDEVDERYHLGKSTEAAAKYFKQAHKTFKSWTSAAASYNRGMNGLQRAMNKQMADSYYDLDLNDETSRYVFKILAFKELVSNPQKYGLKRYRVHKVPTMNVSVKESIEDLTAFALRYRITYKTLKEYNPWLLKNTLTIKESGKSYVLVIPVVKGSPVAYASPKKDTVSYQ